MSDAVRRRRSANAGSATAGLVPRSIAATRSSSGSPTSRRSTSAELARELGVSEMTIRRDIRRLERDGFLRQTYGGATAHLTRSLDVAFNARALQHSREKRLIGDARGRAWSRTPG